MAFRKNKKFIDPRYFMDEKTDILKEEKKEKYPGLSPYDDRGAHDHRHRDADGKPIGKNVDVFGRVVKDDDEPEDVSGRFTGGPIDIEPLSDEEQTAAAEAYYQLQEFLWDSKLPGYLPSEKLQYALRWIAKFEQGAGEPDDIPSDDDPESEYSGFQDRSGPSDTPDEPEEKEYDPADSPFTRPKAARYR